MTQSFSHPNGSRWTIESKKDGTVSIEAACAFTTRHALELAEEIQWYAQRAQEKANA